jgi:hypothetical protein
MVVAADAHAKDCFRLAMAPGADPDTARRCRRQVASMIRLVQSGLRSLQRTQQTREKQAAAMHSAAMERAGPRHLRPIRAPTRLCDRQRHYPRPAGGRPPLLAPLPRRGLAMRACLTG